MLEPVPSHEDVARHTSRVLAAHCRKNGIDIGLMGAVAASVKEAFMILLPLSPATKAKREPAKSAERSGPSPMVRFPDERRRALRDPPNLPTHARPSRTNP